MKDTLTAAAGALAWIALMIGLLVALIPIPQPRTDHADPDLDPIPGGLVSPANDVSRRNEMERAIAELRGRVEALEEGR